MTCVRARARQEADKRGMTDNCASCSVARSRASWRHRRANRLASPVHITPAVSSVPSASKVNALQVNLDKLSFQDLMQQAHGMIVSVGDLMRARELLALALARPEATTTTAAHLLHGSVCLQLGDFQATIGSLSVVSKRDPSNWQAATNLASAYLQLGDANSCELAVQHAEKAVQLHPRLEAANLILVSALRGAALEAPAGSVRRSQFLQQALSAGRELLRLHSSQMPQPPGAPSEPPYCVVGDVLVDCGELEQAWDLAMQAAAAAGQSGPLMSSACVLAGRVQSAAGQYEKALDAYQKASMTECSAKIRATQLRTQLVTKALRHCLPAQQGDVFIATFPKSGTTWMQQVVCMLCGEPADVDIQMRAPYIEAAIATCTFSLARLRSLAQPRLFKTHAAFEDLPVAGCTSIAPPRAAKVVVVVRDPRDVMVSLYYHSKSIRGISYTGSWDDWFDEFLAGRAPLPMASSSSADGGDGSGKDSSKSDWFAHTLGWWKVAQACPEQVLWVRYEDMLSHPLESVKQVAQLVNPAALNDEALLEKIVHASSFGQMKQRHEADPANNKMRIAGGTGHFRKGKAGDWCDHLSEGQRERFNSVMAERLRGSGLEDAFKRK